VNREKHHDQGGPYDVLFLGGRGPPSVHPGQTRLLLYRRWRRLADFQPAGGGVHPYEPGHSAPSGTHDISFYCDDIHQTVADLRAKGVEFSKDVADHGYGLVTYFKMPGNMEVQLYQPKYSKQA
jgi:hypothetical protein